MDDTRVQDLINKIETNLSKTQLKKVEDTLNEVKTEVAKTLNEARQIAEDNSQEVHSFMDNWGLWLIVGIAVIGALSHAV